jgi:hypothetical protein
LIKRFAARQNYAKDFGMVQSGLCVRYVAAATHAYIIHMHALKLNYRPNANGRREPHYQELIKREGTTTAAGHTKP